MLELRKVRSTEKDAMGVAGQEEEVVVRCAW